MKKPLELQERARILKLRAKGMSILAISKELHRSKRTVSAFVKDPVSYLKTLTNNGESSASSSNGGGSSSSNSNIPYNKLSETPSRKSPQPKKVKSITTKERSPADKVSFEHRCVIKFLTRKGWNAAAIHDDMRRVYKGTTPSLNAIEYWIKECTDNPAINFIKRNDKIWTVGNNLKASIKKATTAAKKKKPNKNIENGNDKDKEKTDNKNSPNKNLITVKLFDSDSIRSKISL